VTTILVVLLVLFLLGGGGWGFQVLEREGPNHKLIAGITEMSKSHRPWQGETGLSDKEMLARHLKDAISRILLCCWATGDGESTVRPESTMTTFARKSLLAINPAFEEGKSHFDSNRRTTQRESRRSCAPRSQRDTHTGG
jgi:hypothetical protein